MYGIQYLVLLSRQGTRQDDHIVMFAVLLNSVLLMLLSALLKIIKLSIASIPLEATIYVGHRVAAQQMRVFIVKHLDIAAAALIQLNFTS